MYIYIIFRWVINRIDTYFMIILFTIRNISRKSHIYTRIYTHIYVYIRVYIHAPTRIRRSEVRGERVALTRVVLREQ